MKLEKQPDGTFKISVTYESPIEGETPINWVFKEFTIGQFLKLDVSTDEYKKLTQIAQNAVPVIMMLNAMRIEGPKLEDNTPYRILNFLKMELQDFLT